jgi:hypothetical protein
MKPIDLRDLIKGALAIVFIALVLGRFGELQQFAKKEAAHAMRGGRSKAFFPSGYGQPGR